MPKSNQPFDEQRILITGAAGGLGSAMARAAHQKSATVLLADQAPIETLAQELGDADCFQFDQADLASVARLASSVGHVDVLLNNAGILEVGPLLEMEPEVIQRVIQTNLIGPICLARAIAAQMMQQGGGVIVNTASQLAFDGSATRAVYASAKAGLVQFTKSAAVEWAPLGVRVVALAPGRTLTPINAALLADPAARAEGLKKIPAGRYGNAEEMARLALFLASPDASYIVGETLIADGGYVIS